MRMRDLINIVEREELPARAKFTQAVENLRRAKAIGGEALTIAQQQANDAVGTLPVFDRARALHVINTITLG